MNYRELKDLIAKIVGLRLAFIGYACEMLLFYFEDDEKGYTIHAQCLTRIIKNDDILVTTLDYQSWDREHGENNDEHYNLHRFKTEIEGGKVIFVDINPLYDILITLDNGVTIQILIENSYSHYGEEMEQYRFFAYSARENKTTSAHYVVYSKHIDIDR